MVTIAQMLDYAHRYHQAGALLQAEQLYREVLAVDPANADALHMLSVVALQTGDCQAAVEYARIAIRSNPADTRFHATLGLAYQALRQFDEALASLRQCVLLTPQSPDAHYNLATALKQQGKLDEAAASFRQALLLQPDFAQAHNNLGNVLQEQGHCEQALMHYRQALRIQPGHAQAHNNLGNALRKLGRIDEAAASYQQALAIQPTFAQAHLNLGSVHLDHGAALQDQGRLTEAVASYRQALRFIPESVQAHNNLGNALRMQGQWDEAEASYQEALRLQPDCAEAWHNLGGLWADRGDLAKSATCYQQALQFKPDMAAAHAALGAVRDDQGITDQAIACFGEALRQRPSNRLRIVMAACLPVIPQSLADLEFWRSRVLEETGQLRERQVTQDLTDEPGRPLFYAAYHGLNDRALQQSFAGLYRAPQDFALKPRGGKGKIHVGLASAFFTTHTIGQMTRGIVAQLSRDDFDVTVLSVGSHQDEIAQFFQRHADRYLEVPRHLPTARRLIAEQQLDVLVYTDIGMDHLTFSLAFSRLARVQCTTFGHPMTTGIGTMDYFLSSASTEVEDGDQHYSETLVRLKALPIYYYRPQPRLPLKDRESFGLSSADHVYACPQTLFKFHPEFDEVLGGILRGDPRGKLVLIHAKQPHWDQLLLQRFAVTLPDVLDRVHFVPAQGRHDFLNLMAVSDVLLDPLHFGGGNTSYEALAFGTPVVTLPSRFLRGRITRSLYEQMNMLDCVVASPKEFIQVALRLGTDPGEREQMRRKILAANSVLYENRAGIDALEQFLHQAACGLAH